MNCPSRTDEPPRDAGWNQNPPGFSADLTTRQDFNGIVNLRTNQDSSKEADDARTKEDRGPVDSDGVQFSTDSAAVQGFPAEKKDHVSDDNPEPTPSTANADHYRRKVRFPGNGKVPELLHKAWAVASKFMRFIGPGFIIAVAYIDPGNYSTDVAAGAGMRFKLLFIVLMSNVFAIVLQSLAVRLGTVTGMNLAEHCRAHLPRWLNFVLYILGEAAIIATDIAEVIGSAIALNLLFKIPLVAGCAITLVDVLVILIFYSPTGSMRRLRAFEYFVMALVLGVVVCFCIQLSLISPSTTVGNVFAGYLPSSTLVHGQGIYLSCGILGATVMPHSLYLGSGMVQPRLREFDNAGLTRSSNTSSQTLPNSPLTATTKPTIPAENYRPSLAAVNHCLTYSIAEMAIALFTFALFVNSAILITAGASLYNPSSPTDTSSLFSIHDLLSSTLAPAAGTIFALALLLSGTSAGIVCTIAGQMLSEGALNWTIKPWVRRLLTRSISIVPSIIIAGAVGKEGLSAALNGTQVALSVVLPFVSAPLIYFTCRNRFMVVGGRDTSYPRASNPKRFGTVDLATARRSGDAAGGVLAAGNGERAVAAENINDNENDDDFEAHELDIVAPAGGREPVKMRNQIWVSVLAVLIWCVIAVMNVALLVLLGLGEV